jgi:hypothetical protein
MNGLPAGSTSMPYTEISLWFEKEAFLCRRLLVSYLLHIFICCCLLCGVCRTIALYCTPYRPVHCTAVSVTETVWALKRAFRK